MGEDVPHTKHRLGCVSFSKMISKQTARRARHFKPNVFSQKPVEQDWVEDYEEKFKLFLWRNAFNIQLVSSCQGKFAPQKRQKRANTLQNAQESKAAARQKGHCCQQWFPNLNHFQTLLKDRKKWFFLLSHRVLYFDSIHSQCQFDNHSLNLIVSQCNDFIFHLAQSG